MMSRKQRIEFEILDCTLSGGATGFSTTVPGFMTRLLTLFPGLQVEEFADTCRRLLAIDALHLCALDKSGPGIREYQGVRDDLEFFHTNSKLQLHLRSSASSQPYFQQLSALIELPDAFKQWMRRR